MIDAILKSVLACLEVANTINVTMFYFTVTKRSSLARSLFEDWQGIWISVILETIIARLFDQKRLFVSRNLTFYDSHSSASSLKNSQLHRLNLQERI